MPRPAPALPALAALIVLLASLPTGGQDPTPASESSLRTFFSVRSAQEDDTLPEELRKEFEKDDGGPLRSVAIDLDGDGKDEKFYLSAVLAASGGYQWLIYDTATGSLRGLVVGTLIFVSRQTDNGFPRLETYWKQAGDMSVVFEYVFGRRRYNRVDTYVLTLAEASDYFRAKPPLDLDKELVEIK